MSLFASKGSTEAVLFALSKHLLLVGGAGILLLAMVIQTLDWSRGGSPETDLHNLKPPSVSQDHIQPSWSTETHLAQQDTAASVRWTLVALDVQQQAQRARLQARVDAARGDSTGLPELRAPSPPVSKYPWTLLALAQHNATRRTGTANANVEVSIAVASTEVISELFPTLRTQVQDRLDAELRAHSDTSGAVVGRNVARAWITELENRSQGSVPTEYVGPMGWWTHPGRVPDGLDVATADPIVLDSADQFRPPPPPAPDVQAFADALEEVRRAAQRRTPAQRRAARFWALRNGATEWTRRTAHLLAREGVPDPAAAAVLARLQAAITDATIACFEAKYHYGLLRPEHADSTITRPWAVALPNFPAYPAGHACTAGAAETILTNALPGAEPEIRDAAHEMAESRLWGGVHYRFDNEAGLTLGRDVARFVMAHPERLALPNQTPPD